MKFVATEDQVRQMAVNAVKASSPMGMGYLHFDADAEFHTDDFPIDNFGLNLDYIQGRMVKLTLRKLENNEWETCGRDTPTPDYQSWVRKYPTYEDLCASVGVTEILE